MKTILKLILAVAAATASLAAAASARTAGEQRFTPSTQISRIASSHAHGPVSRSEFTDAGVLRSDFEIREKSYVCNADVGTKLCALTIVLPA
jgi:hypothetical protein